MAKLQVLSDFCQGVSNRVRTRYGFDWTLIITLLPALIEMIQNCFNRAEDLQTFAAGRRNPLQLARLRRQCKTIVQEEGVRGMFRVAAAASDLQEAILAELDERYKLAAGDVFQEAFREATDPSL